MNAKHVKWQALISLNTNLIVTYPRQSQDSTLNNAIIKTYIYKSYLVKPSLPQIFTSSSEAGLPAFKVLPASSSILPAVRFATCSDSGPATFPIVAVVTTEEWPLRKMLESGPSVLR